MNNLKRVLSLGMAGTMLAGMMTAGAADFTDAEKIEHVDAVNALSALNVINGKDDGSFDPSGSLTRAEMAKLAVFILNGGKEPILGTKVNPTFTDTKGHWAEKYIEYCASTGIINGQGDGTFNPNGTLTGSQAAKMLMVAMGYNGEVFGFTGSDWEINTNVEANNIGLYDELETMDASTTITRDNAAQLVYNAMFAGIMEKSYSHNIVTGAVTNGYELDTTKNLFTEKFKGIEKNGYLTDATYNEDTEEYTYTVNYDTVGGVSASILGAGTDVLMSTTEDFTSLLGRSVTALYKDATGSVESCFGIYAEDDVVVATVGELDSVSGSNTKAELAGEKYKLENNYADTNIYVFTSGAIADSGKDLDDTTADKASALALVDTNNNGKFDYAIVYPVTVAKVTYVGTNGITAGAAYTYDDDNIVDGLKKGDFVTVTAAANTVYSGNVIEKVETITGTVAGIKNTTDVKVDGTWYKKAMNNGDAVSLNDEFTFAVIGGYYYNAELVDENASMDNLVLAIDTDDVVMAGQNAKFLLADNSKVVKNVTKIGGNEVSSSNEVAADTLYTYKEKDGNWELTTVGTTNDLGYTYVASAGKFNAAGTNTDATIGTSYHIADDAVVFVKYMDSKAEYKAVSGKVANDWSTGFGDSSVGLYKTVNGVKYLVAVSITDASNKVPSSTGETGNYGYIVTAPYQAEIDDTNYAVYKIWTGSETIEVKDEDNALDITKGDIISYTDLGNGIINTSEKVAGGSTAAVAVTGYSNKTFQAIKADGSAIEDTIVTDDTVFLYVDSKNVAGVEGGEITLAAQQADGSYIMNAWAVQTDDSNSKVEALKLIVIEVNNDIDDLANNGAGAAGFSITDATLTGTDTGVTVSTDLDKAAAGDTVTITLTLDGTATATEAYISTLTDANSDAVNNNDSSHKMTVDKDGTYTLTITVGTGNITTITVTLA